MAAKYRPIVLFGCWNAESLIWCRTMKTRTERQKWN